AGQQAFARSQQQRGGVAATTEQAAQCMPDERAQAAEAATVGVSMRRAHARHAGPRWHLWPVRSAMPADGIAWQHVVARLRVGVAWRVPRLRAVGPVTGTLLAMRSIASARSIATVPAVAAAWAIGAAV